LEKTGVTKGHRGGVQRKGNACKIKKESTLTMGTLRLGGGVKGETGDRGVFVQKKAMGENGWINRILVLLGFDHRVWERVAAGRALEGNEWGAEKKNGRVKKRGGRHRRNVLDKI